MINGTEKELKHVVVYNKLYSLIKNGSFSAGYQLPSEPELATKMGVSRVTLRRALSLLQEDGLIENIRGKGNFVTSTENSMPEYIKRVQNPMKMCCKQGYDEVEIAFRFETPSQYISETLKSSTSVVIIADRWYKKNGKTIAHSLSLLPIEVISENKINLNDENEFKEFLETSIYENSLNAETQFTYTTTGNFTADKYTLSENDNFILISETLYTKENQILLNNKHYIPVEYFKLTIRLSDKFEL